VKYNFVAVEKKYCYIEYCFLVNNFIEIFNNITDKELWDVTNNNYNTIPSANLDDLKIKAQQNISLVFKMKIFTVIINNTIIRSYVLTSHRRNDVK
jgi:hypothetical protein